MIIKLQNVLFVLGVTFVIQLLYMLLMFIIFLLNNNLAVSNEELFLFVLDNVLFVSIAVGAINLFSNRLSLYIYEKSIKKYLIYGGIVCSLAGLSLSKNSYPNLKSFMLF